MTAHEVEEDIRRALNSGAKGYLLKGANLLEIRDGVGKGCRRTIHRYREHR
jgi:DNA-binding NarL/FixJ family response regulator